MAPVALRVSIRVLFRALSHLPRCPRCGDKHTRGGQKVCACLSATAVPTPVWCVLMLPCTLPTSCDRSWGVLPALEYTLRNIFEGRAKHPIFPPFRMHVMSLY